MVPPALANDLALHLGIRPKMPLTLIHRYADQAAFDVHNANPKLQEFVDTQQEEGNFAGPLDIYSLDAFAGWTCGNPDSKI